MVVEDNRFDDAVKVLLDDDYLRQCFCKPQLPDEDDSREPPFYHFGFYAAGEAHFVDRDCSAPPFQLWRRSIWLPYADLSRDKYTTTYFPSREEQILHMQDEDEAYLLHGISCVKPRSFRILTQAQMVETAMLNGARSAKFDRSQSIAWARIFLHTIIYLGTVTGTFHHPSFHSLYSSWMNSPPRPGSQSYLEEVSRAMASSENSLTIACPSDKSAPHLSLSREIKCD